MIGSGGFPGSDRMVFIRHVDRFIRVDGSHDPGRQSHPGAINSLSDCFPSPGWMIDPGVEGVQSSGRDIIATTGRPAHGVEPG